MPQTLALTPDLLDESRSAPLYQQVYDLLREEIIGGNLTYGDRLPAEQELTGQLGVSRITVKRAMNELAMAGLVRRQRGIGTVVTYDATAPLIRASFDTMIDGLTRMGLDTEAQLLDCCASAASPAVAEALAIKPGASVQRIVRLRSLDGAPFSHLITHIPEDIAEAFQEADIASGSLIALLERAGHTPVEAEQTIAAVPAEAAVAANLGVASGAPLLRIHRLMRDASHRPVQDIVAHYRADRFEYRMALGRTESSKGDWVSRT